MTNELRDEQRLAIIKHLATGKSIDVVATIAHVDKEQVRELASRHGYPDKEKLSWAADILEKNIEQARRGDLPQGTTPMPSGVDRPPPSSRPAGSTTTPQATRHLPTPAAAEQPPSKPDEFRVLINTAKNHDRKKIQNLADKILDDLAKLRGWIDEEAEAFRVRQAAAAEKEAARAEVKRLEEQLAEAKAKLRGSTVTPTVKPDADGPSAADIRAWAREHDVECPATGRVPGTVREAYGEAHSELEAAS
jgi:hypothetical protein